MWLRGFFSKVPVKTEILNELILACLIRYICDYRMNHMAKVFLSAFYVLIVSLTVCLNTASAQLVDGVLGQKRTVVQVLLRPYRILDYKMERVVHSIDNGIHQTVLYQNDTCNRFYWAVTPNASARFEEMLLQSGYQKNSDVLFEKDSLQLTVKPLESGQATLFIASISQELKGNRDASGKPVVVRSANASSTEPIPLLQQAVKAEEGDTTKVKKPKNPQRNWVGGKYGKTNILGWDK